MTPEQIFLACMQGSSIADVRAQMSAKRDQMYAANAARREGAAWALQALNRHDYVSALAYWRGLFSHSFHHGADIAAAEWRQHDPDSKMDALELNARIRYYAAARLGRPLGEWTVERLRERYAIMMPYFDRLDAGEPWRAVFHAALDARLPNDRQGAPEAPDASYFLAQLGIE